MKDVCLDVEGKRLIDRVSLTLFPETISLFMGPSGAGKSLLLRLLHGLLSPSRGSITWAGRVLDDRMRKRQAMVFQNPVMLNRSVLANLTFVLRLVDNNHPHVAMELLERVALRQHARQPAMELSGGERQRLAIAKALAVQPEVLFLDEAMSHLDPPSVTLIEELILQQQRQGIKVIMVSHDLGQIQRLADEIFFVHQGQLVEHAVAQTFFANPQSFPAQLFLQSQSWSKTFYQE
ncbi:MAG TPA: ATP-binding cassette domain-containing protein [Magnetococcales bacterium]|nr:ATP-binding cassette domain-containing protein [Magnetococcales bacterium]